MPDRLTDMHPHLAEPNYYRLAYQLAAQRMHAYLTIVGESGEHGETKAGDISPIEGATEGSAIEASRFLTDARTGATKLIKEASSMQAWFRARAERPWWVRGQRLKPGERRLEQFLSATVLPSAKLLRAGIMVAEGNRTGAECLAQPIRDKVQDANLSYRTAYNLACYEVAAAAPDESGGGTSGAVEHQVDAQLDPAHLDAALKALREALSGIHGRRRLELGQWARKDPAMKALSQCPQTRQSTQASQPEQRPQPKKRRTYSERFNKLLGDYGITGPVVPGTNETAASGPERLSDGELPHS
jgi:hypothetical protein